MAPRRSTSARSDLLGGSPLVAAERADELLAPPNVRSGSKPAVITHRDLRPLSGVKRTKLDVKRTSVIACPVSGVNRTFLVTAANGSF